MVSAVATYVGGCSEKQSIDQNTYTKNEPSSKEETEVDKKENDGGKQPKPKTESGEKGVVSDPNAGEAKGLKAAFNICTDGLKKHAALKDYGAQVSILCDDGKLEAVLDKANVFTGGERKLFEMGKKIGDLQTSFKIYSGGAYDSLPEDYWNLLRLQFIKPKVFRDNYLDDPNAKMDLVVPSGDFVTYRYFNNSGEGGVIEYDAKTVFVTLKSGKAWVAVTQKVGPYRETMESLQSLQIVFESDGNPGKTSLVSISDQIYKHASGQGQSYYDRAMNNLTTEQKNGFINAKTSQKAKGLLGE